MVHMVTTADFLQIITFWKLKQISSLSWTFDCESVNSSGHLGQNVNASVSLHCQGDLEYNVTGCWEQPVAKSVWTIQHLLKYLCSSLSMIQAVFPKWDHLIWLVDDPGQISLGNMVHFPSSFWLTTHTAIVRECSKQLNFL